MYLHTARWLSESWWPEIKLKLGLVADIWPSEIYGDLVIDALEHAERPTKPLNVIFP